MNTRLLRLLIGGVAFGALGARAEILFDQMTNPSNTIIPSSWVTPDGSDSDAYAWDNFLLPSDSTINEVWWVGGGGTITRMSSAGTGPGRGPRAREDRLQSRQRR